VRREYVGRYRKASNSYAIFIPLEVRQELIANHGWKPGDYLLVVPHDGLLMIQRLDKTMIRDRTNTASLDQRSK
jgi:bifunctional DNA-binding transcriptional regulator/antitoxin component of YhaV-PrlF toxin-antitoxin module